MLALSHALYCNAQPVPHNLHRNATFPLGVNNSRTSSMGGTSSSCCCLGGASGLRHTWRQGAQAATEASIGGV